MKNRTVPFVVLYKEKEYFSKAKEYYKNAKKVLEDIPVEYDFYKNQKKVQKSAGICFLAMDFAIKGYLIKRGLDEKKVLSYTWDGLKFLLIKHSPMDGKFRKNLEIAYRIVYMDCYYRGVTYVKTVKEGYEKTKLVIEKLTNESL